MATTVALVGGPCDGETVRISDATLASGHLTCKGATYTRLRQVQTGGHITFGSNAPTPAPGGSPSAPSIFQSNVYRSWGDIERSVNRGLPTALHRITVSQTRLLQALAHKRRVRH